MSTHPTTAQLAAFRRSYTMDQLGNDWPTAFMPSPDGDGRAHAAERRDGIGFRWGVASTWAGGDARPSVTDFRREAAAMRSRAYPIENNPPEGGAWWRERQGGCPDGNG